MATKAHLEGNKRYLTEQVETIAVRVPNGEKAVIKAHAEKLGKSLNGYIVDLIHADMAHAASSDNKFEMKRIDSNITVLVKKGTEIAEKDKEEITRILEENKAKEK